MRLQSKLVMGRSPQLRGEKLMNAKKERELLVVGLERLLRKESKIVDDYRALAEMLEGIPVGLLLDWVVIEQEAHHTLLINIIHSLSRPHRREAKTARMAWRRKERPMLCWVTRLRTKEQTVVAACHSLKSQACWETGDV